MSITPNDYADGEVLTAARLNALATNINAHTHAAGVGELINFQTAVDPATRQAQYLSTGRSGAGGGTGIGSSVQNHIDTVGSAAGSVNNPHGVAMDYVGDYAITAAGKNNALMWFPAGSMIWSDEVSGVAITGAGSLAGNIVGWQAITVDGKPPAGMVCNATDSTWGHFNFPFFHNQASTKVRISLLWMTATGSTNAIMHGIGLCKLGGSPDFSADPGSPTNTSLGAWGTMTPTLVTTTAAISANIIYQTTISFNSITSGLTDDCIASVMVGRDGNHGSDTHAAASLIIGAMVSFWVDHPISS